MDNKLYFLKLCSQISLYDDFAVVIPRCLFKDDVQFEKYRRLYDDVQNGGFECDGETDIQKLKEKYPEYRIFYLNAAVKDNQILFSLDYDRKTAVGFVFIKESLVRGRYSVKFAQFARLLSDYINNRADWIVSVTDQNGKDADVFPQIIYGGNITESDEQWLQSCREKYNITEEEITAVKNRIDAHKHHGL